MNNAQRRLVKNQIQLLNGLITEMTNYVDGRDDLEDLTAIRDDLELLLEPTKTFIVRMTLSDGSFTALTVDDYSEGQALEQLGSDVKAEVIGWRNVDGSVALKEGVTG